MSSFQRNVLPLVAVAGLALLPAISHAQYGGEYAFPAESVASDPVLNTGPITCAEAMRAAWFRRQLEITDGDVSPAIAKPAECERELFAKADKGDDDGDKK